jgi:hypothetical protein
LGVFVRLKPDATDDETDVRGEMMPKVLKLVMVSLGAVVLSSAVALAQTPPPNSGGQTPTSSNHSKPHKRSAKKSAHKKSAKKKTAKKPPQ